MAIRKPESVIRPEHTGNLIVNKNEMVFETVSDCPKVHAREIHSGHTWVLYGEQYWCRGLEVGGTDDNVDASPRGSNSEPR